jgi:hypothetical protein
MRLALVAAVSLVASWVASPVFAGPPPPKATPISKAACLAAHEEALQLKTDKKPHAAQEKLLVCAKPECPTIVRKECTEQLDVVSAAGPTVVVDALDDKGQSDAAVKVSIDGAVVADKLTGAAINVEPGEHTFDFERASDGKKMQQKVLVVEGEKNHKVTADYQSLVPKPPPEAPPPPPAPKKVPILAYVAGGVAVAGFGSFAFFAIAGRGKEGDLSSTCKPVCTDKQISPVKTDYLIGDISLGVGIVGLAAAVILALPALTSGPEKTASAAPWMPRVQRVSLR